MIHGRNLIVSIDGEPIAAAKSCNVSVNQDFIQACSPTEGRVFTKIPTTYDWSVSVDCLVLDNSAQVNGFMNKLIAGTRCLLTFTDGTNNQKRAGFAYIKSWDESGSIGNLATFRASFEPSGPIYNYTEYKTAAFTEGETLELIISGGALSYNFESQGTSTFGVELKPTRNGYLYLVMDWTHAVYADSFNDIKNGIFAKNPTTLNSHLEAFGDNIGTVVSVVGGSTYTVLMDDHSSINKIFMLY